MDQKLTRFDGDCVEKPDEETRRIQGELYRKLIEGTLKCSDLDKWKKHLDIYIVIELCDMCLRDDVTNLGFGSDVQANAKAILEGHCVCDIEQEEERTRKVLKLVHLASMSDKFLPVLRHLHKLGCDMDARCTGDAPTPLHVAIHNEHVEAVKFLITCDVDVNYSHSACDSPLAKAVSMENKEIVEALLQCKSLNVNMVNPGNHSLLAHFVRMRSPFVEALLKAGADPNKTGRSGTSPLMYAVQSRNIEMIKLLIQYGADVNLKNERGDSPLMIALYLGFTGMANAMEILLDAGANPNDYHQYDGNCLLLVACYDNNIDIVKMLIRYHANVMQKNHLEYMPLHIAAWNGHLELVRMLLKAGAPHDVRTQDKNTPLALAAHGGHLSVIEELLPYGCVINNYDKDDDTPIHYAAYNGMTRAVELLIEHGADPNCRSKCQATPLWNAVYRKRKEVVKLLIKKNVKMEVASVGTDQHSHSDQVVHVYNTPRSPLWVAAEGNQLDIVQLLILAGYDMQGEQWLINDQFPDGLQNDPLRNILSNYAHSPRQLMDICKIYFRNYLGLRITESVANMNIPVTLKNFLSLEDLQYRIDERDTQVDNASDSDD